jgi:hypothetical protein
MLFTWNTQDLCIVFRQWHVSGTFSLLWSLLAIVLLTAGYEAVREISRRYETYSNNPRRVDDSTSESHLFFKSNWQSVQLALIQRTIRYCPVPSPIKTERMVQRSLYQRIELITLVREVGAGR